MSKVLLITGMHRSGTSVLSRWLHEMGLSVGQALHPLSKPIEEGHYEDIDFLNFHRRVLSDNELPYTVQPDEHITLTAEHRELARQLVNARSHMPQWGFKDPRTCLFLDFWSELLAQHEVFYLFIRRNEKAVVKSLMNRVQRAHRERIEVDGWDFNKLKKSIKLGVSKDSWRESFYFSTRRHVQDCQEFSEKHLSKNMLFIDYEELPECQEQVLQTLRQDWGFELNPVDIKTFFHASTNASNP